MKLLVTGDVGFIGSNLALELERLGHDVTVFDNLSVGTFANLRGFTGSVIADDPSRLSYQRLLEIAPDAIFHQAAITDTTVYDEKLMLQANLDPMEPLLKYSSEKNAPLIYESSAAVYGAAKSPQRESDAGVPLNVYGFSKWVCDCTTSASSKNTRKPASSACGTSTFSVRESRTRAGWLP